MAPAKNKVIIIAGPTAVGKTAIAIAIAKKLGTEIISADSRQCYKELNIGVARPSEKELAEVKHYFIASHSIHDKLTAVDFEQYALKKLTDIFQKAPVAVMTGGTGLYLKAFCEGMDEIPQVPAAVRDEIKQQHEARGLLWMQEEIKKHDPLFYQTGEIQNPQRLMRALEVLRATGRSVLDFRKGKKRRRDFDIIKIALHLDKELLHERINNRVDSMMQHGLVEEVRSLIPYQHLNALQTVGYKELFDHFNGIASMDAAIEFIKRNTRQYAKRQMTWFRKDKEYNWMEPDVTEVESFLKDQKIIQ